ncbi:MAG TPA: 4-alpha-glucanotransferase [Pyrinomonadaceae bacterium]|nr:4-alpha-glucanotransferase [Pyrinomonadaceae bacterium]
MRLKRSSGILLHPTSLPGRFGVGDFGGEAYRFVDWLAAAGQTFWQLMPLGPTGYGDSPYSSFSAFAGNTNLVSPEKLVESGLLADSDIQPPPDLPAERVDYGKVIEYKRGLLEKAFQNFKTKVREDDGLRGDYEGFLGWASVWIEDYALFAALKDEHKGEPWHTWAPGLARREASALDGAQVAYAEPVQAHKFFQYVFFRQWLILKKYANERGVRVVGDMPIFVAHNSSDVWARPELFKLNEDGSPKVVAGVPPDAFSSTGQRWGNPIYDWDRMREGGFEWWTARVRETLRIVDVVRLDHFRGFAAYWEVPAEHETAEHGRWVEAPGREVFQAMRAAVGGELPIVAEDLGTITPDVHQLRDEFDFPGMRVLQFAFGGDPHDTHLPHEYVHNTVAYTGTHDNDTVVGWFRQRSREDAPEWEKRERELCLKYLGTDGAEINWDFIRAVQMSVAVLAVAQLQDVLGLSSEARMNTPASTEGNWAWRFQSGALTDELATRLREMTRIYGRLP